MGDVEVLVGCPHRLRSPIGPSTRKPCPACAEAGFPGLWAIALTVDYPRLARDAVEGVVKARVRLPKVEQYRLPESVERALRQMRESLATIKPPDLSPLSRMVEQMARSHRDALAKIASQTTIETSPMRVHHTAAVGNTVTVHVEQDYRVRAAERIAAEVAELRARQRYR